MTMWRKAGVVLAAALATTLALAPAGSANATAQASAPQGPSQATAHVQMTEAHGRPGVLATNLTLVYWGYWQYGSYTVDIWWGFDYNPATNHLRAYAEMSGNSSSIHVQAEPLNLGDRNGILASKYANSQTGFLAVSTAAVNCHYPNGVYRSNLHYSIRWPNGTLTSNQQTGRFEASASLICT